MVRHSSYNESNVVPDFFELKIDSMMGQLNKALSNLGAEVTREELSHLYESDLLCRPLWSTKTARYHFPLVRFRKLVRTKILFPEKGHMMVVSEDRKR